MNVCIYMNVRTYVCMYACMYVCIYLCMYVCMYVCMYACMFVCMYACMYVCLYLCMYVCMYVYMYVCIYVCMQARREAVDNTTPHCNILQHAATLSSFGQSWASSSRSCKQREVEKKSRLSGLESAPRFVTVFFFNQWITSSSLLCCYTIVAKNDKKSWLSEVLHDS